ncbi:hypothetical protein N657DRAFT_329638 [Parathielavia appendiculata]|uniref:Uncharacterized protein n=1 Tax=Parathielavia appendiculata TaxID=2587402 RepID=A0AAN6TRE3_9PEZI|nr:hypothetical protein N657DRAFT_329638 [Parathielavia appendiculata]
MTSLSQARLFHCSKLVNFMRGFHCTSLDNSSLGWLNSNRMKTRSTAWCSVDISPFFVGQTSFK